MANEFPQMPDFFSGGAGFNTISPSFRNSLFNDGPEYAVIVNSDEWEQERFQEENPIRKWIYHFESGNDGARLIRNYLQDTKLDKGPGTADDNLVDICIYYETGSYSNPVCLIKMTSEVYTVLTGKKNGEKWKKVFIDSIVLKEARYGRKINAERIRAALDKATSEFGRIGLLYQLGIYLLQEVAELIRNMKIPEQSWNPNHPDYSPPTLIRLLNLISNKWEKLKSRLEKFRKRLKELAEWFEDVAIIGPFFAGLIESIDIVLNAVVSVGQVIADIVETAAHYLKLIYAFVSGAVNEVIEMIASIADLLALLISLKDETERLLFKRTIEDIIDEYRENPGKIIDQLKEGFESFAKRYSSDTGEYNIAYNLGEDAVRVILFVESVIASIRLIKNLPKSFKKLKSYFEKSEKRIKDIFPDEHIPDEKLAVVERSATERWKLKIRHTRLDLETLKFLEQKRVGDKFQNVARMTVKVELDNGKVIRKHYIANSGPENLLGKEGVDLSKNTLEKMNAMKKRFRDGRANRVFDSEHKMIVKFNQEFADMKISWMQVEFESILKPCVRCQEQILNFQQKNKALVLVKSTQHKDAAGKIMDVLGIKQLNEFLETIN